jgi:imidazolonepropionase
MLLKNIRGLVGAFETPPPFVAGSDMSQFPVVEDAWLAVEAGRVVDWGEMSEFPGIADWSGLEVVDCSGRYVLPAWCDSHTHLVFAGNRSGEFQDRLDGMSYQEIAAKGGGILHSAAALEATSEEILFEAAWGRLQAAMRDGVGAMEIKTGYGLSVAGELKSLAVVARLRAHSPIPVRLTLLGLHAVPKGFQDASAWTEKAIHELLPQAMAQGGCDYIDGFCEQGYFDTSHLRAWTEAGRGWGLRAKWHVNQFSAFGGVAEAVALGARSVDHLEVCTAEDVRALQAGMGSPDGPTFPVALPGCSHFLSIPYAPGRALIDAGLPLVLATDHNPGSAPSGSMTRTVQRAMVTMRLKPLEAIAAATLNGAAAMDLAHEVGTLSRDRRANFMVTRPMNHLVEIGYYFDENPIDWVCLNGTRVDSR